VALIDCTTTSLFLLYGKLLIYVFQDDSGNWNGLERRVECNDIEVINWLYERIISIMKQGAM
jgi:hypothetical protein